MNRKIGCGILAFALVVTSVPGAGFCADESGATPVTASVAETAEKVPAAPVASAAPATAPAAAPEEKPVPDEAPVTAPGNVTVNFKGADITTVLLYISEIAGVDIVPAPEVKGPIDLKLTNKPWKTALDIIMRNYNLAYEREGDIIRVVTQDKLKQEEPITQTFVLNYGDVDKVKDALAGMLTGGAKDKNDRRIQTDRRTNTIIVTDQPTRMYAISQVIDKLDRQTQQVLIEARIIETVLGDNEKLGIDWNVKVSASGAKRPMTWPFDYYDVDNSFLNKYTPLVQDGVSAVTYPAGGAGAAVVTEPGEYPSGAAGTGSGSKGFPYVDYAQEIFADTFTFGTLDFSEFSAVLEMIKTRSNTDIVSNPRIATLDNKEAVINVGQTFNFPKFERNSTTGKMEITGYDPKDLGIILKVTPHINNKGEIVVSLSPEISSFEGTEVLDKAAGVVAPVFGMRKAETQVIIQDGQTIFIGGLIKENIIDVKNRVPIIGDIIGDTPYLDLLFTRKEKKIEKRELIFFITVHIMTPGKRISGSPIQEKALNPQYTLSQKESADKPKKKTSWFRGK